MFNHAPQVAKMFDSLFPTMRDANLCHVAIGILVGVPIAVMHTIPDNT